MMNHTINILLVDDDLKNSMLLKRFLEVEGYCVTYANNGAIGWELYHTSNPDLILLDINMPEINGFELAKKIREINKKVLIFFLTDRTEKDDRLKGFQLKGNDYIPKPFYPEELIAKINERFENRTIETQQEYLIGNTLFDSNISTVTYNGVSHTLTARQTDILLLLSQNIGKMVEREQILRTVWGDDSNANSLALNVQITYLRRILEDDASISIVSLKKKGYILQVK
jgi:DNA-binding response OmpR family regulator